MVAATIFHSAYQARGDSLILRVFGRDVNGARINASITGVRPYFYVDAAEAGTVKEVQQIVDSEPGPRAIDGRPTLKVYTRFPFDVPEARKRFRWHGEADVLFTIRTRVDHSLVHVDIPQTGVARIVDVRPIDDPRVTSRKLYLDTEVDDFGGYADADNPVNPVIAVSVYDSYKKAYGCIYSGDPVEEEAVRAHFPERIAEPIRFFPVSTERDLLGSLGELLGKAEPDIVAAYNGYDYDYKYLAGRAERILGRDPANPDLRLLLESFHPDHRQHRGRYAMIDPLAVYRKQELRQKSFSLESVAQEILGFGKIRRPSSVSKLRHDNPEKFLAYAIFDTHLLRLIDERKKFCDYFVKIANLSHVLAEDCLFNQRVVDGKLMRTARRSGPPRVVLPSKDFAPRRAMRGRAAEVFDPVVGMHEGVVVFDLKQEYPSIILTFNISPETRDPLRLETSYVLPTGGAYRKDPVGLIPEALIDMRKHRDAVKEEAARHPLGSPGRDDADGESKALKFVVNSFAGVLDSPHWRMADTAIFEDVTGMARAQLNWNRQHLEDPEWLSRAAGASMIGRVISGDTDSCFVRFWRGADPIVDTDELLPVASRLREALNASYEEFVRQYGATTNYTEVGVEGIFRRLQTLPIAGSSTEGAKKRYFGLYEVENGKDVRDLPIAKRIKITGLETKRFNNAPITKEVQTRIVEMMLTGASPIDVRKYIDGVERDAADGKRDEDLLIPCKMGMESFDLYRSKQPFVRAIENYFEATGNRVRHRDEFRWTYVAESSYDVMAIPLAWSISEAALEGVVLHIDRAAMIEKAVLDPARLVCPDLKASSYSLDGEW